MTALLTSTILRISEKHKASRAHPAESSGLQVGPQWCSTYLSEHSPERGAACLSSLLLLCSKYEGMHPVIQSVSAYLPVRPSWRLVCEVLLLLSSLEDGCGSQMSSRQPLRCLQWHKGVMCHVGETKKK